MRLWVNSVRNAVQGIRYALEHERNMRIEVSLAAAAVILMLVLDITVVEALLVTLAMVLVICSELINTSIEKTLDMIQPERHPLAKAAKDCAAAAVLLFAVFAILVGIAVFGPHVWEGPVWRWK